MLRELIKDILTEEFNKQGESGLIIWYDEVGSFSGLLDESVPGNVSLLKFEGSYLALRFALESQDPDFKRRWLVYIPEKPHLESWLRDWELLGIRLDMDLLEFLKRKFSIPISPKLVELFRKNPQNSVDLVSRWEVLFAGIDISEKTVIDSLLALGFRLNQWEIEEAILHFLGGNIRQADLEKRGLWSLWQEKIAEWTGWVSLPPDEAALKKRLEAGILLSELVEAVPDLVSPFRSVLLKKAQRPAAVHLARIWRNRENLRETYLKAAERVEREYDLATKITVGESLLDAETFLVIDNLWRQEVIVSVGPDGANFRERLGSIAGIADKRKALFWARNGRAAFWEPLSLACKLLAQSDMAIQEGENFSKIDEFIAAYTKENGWWKTDAAALELASKFNNLNPDEQNRILQPAWREYGKYLHKINLHFGEAVQREGWKPNQFEFWSRYVQAKKSVVFFIDALRFDLARKLMSLLPNNEFEIGLEILKGQLPSLTEIGMSALLPIEGNSLLIDVVDDSLKVAIGDQEVGSLNKRLDWLNERISRHGRVLLLHDVRKIDVKNLDLLILISREIDKLGMFSADVYPQGFQEIIKQIHQTICYLRDQGFERFVITSDHGFLFVPSDIQPTRIEAPHSKICKRRFAIGGTQKGCFVARSDDLALKGSEVMCFPLGLSVFALPGESGNFLHGGLSLQECLIPVLRVKSRLPVEKVSVILECPAKLTSRIAIIGVKVKEARLFSKPRHVRIEINDKESETIEMSLDKQEARIQFKWLEFDETPPEKAVIQLVDADTLQILEKFIVPVEILI